MDHPLPDNFVRINMSLRGSEGAEWLARLPARVADYERRWSLRVEPPFPNLSYNYAARALRADGSEAVLKIGTPDGEFLTEMQALRIYAGRGSVQLLEADAAGGAMLLEFVRPGTLLSTLDDDAKATEIAAHVMRQLWQPAPAEHQFPTVEDWARGMSRLRAEFAGGVGPFPAHLVDEAERLFPQLLASQTERVVLHGDLHHFNILAAEREPWLAIDPKGVVGEPAYEPGALLRNPMPHVATWPDLPRILARRIDILSSELGFDRERLRAWALAQAVLSAWWSYEDHGEMGEESLAIAEALSGLKY